MTRKLIEHTIPLDEILEYINRAQDVRDRIDVALSTQTSPSSRS
jgi:hypothetical protein